MLNQFNEDYAIMHINILQPRPATSRQQEAKLTRTGHKRALPPRHSFLTEAVKIALEKQSSTEREGGESGRRLSLMCMADIAFRSVGAHDRQEHGAVHCVRR